MSLIIWGGHIDTFKKKTKLDHHWVHRVDEMCSKYEITCVEGMMTNNQFAFEFYEKSLSKYYQPHAIKKKDEKKDEIKYKVQMQIVQFCCFYQIHFVYLE